MLGIILSGHGRFASGMAQAMRQLIGSQQHFIAIDFPPESSVAQLTCQCQAALAELDRDNNRSGVVFLTDLLGGTPFRVASTLALQKPAREVIAGTNLQLLVEMMLERDGLSCEAFRLMALESGRRGLTSLADELAQQRTSQQPADGI